VIAHRSRTDEEALLPASALLVGAHVSAASGLHRAVERESAIGCTALQVFTRSPSRWQSPPLDGTAIRAFRDAVAARAIRFITAHDAYLINLASPHEEVRQRSVAAMLDEIDRADLLGIPCVIAHPGAHMGAGEEAGLARLVESLDQIADAQPEARAVIGLDVTAGQGTALGWRLEHLAHAIAHVAAPERLAACFDTCHAHAAGYDLVTREGFDETWEAFDRIIGAKSLVAIHMNDAKRERGSRVDRHEHIGRGFLGLDPFVWTMKSARFRDVPKIVETPQAETMHRVNVAWLRELAGADCRTP